MSKPRPRLERHEQADGVKLLRLLGAAVYVERPEAPVFALTPEDARP